jgi:hypothetical protein
MFDVELISIEHNNTASESAVEELLKRKGYGRRFKEFAQWDSWYRKARN